MPTRSGLVAAVIENMITNEKVECTFNPYEYTITKQNEWEAKPRKGKDTPKLKFKSGGAQTLKLKVYFDTSLSGSDVRGTTDKLMTMMLITDSNRHAESDKSSPPGVAFSWGSFQFKAILKTMTQKFTLFDTNGKPLRCECDLTLQQVEDQAELGSPAGPVAAVVPVPNTPVATVTSADRIDTVVAQNNGDPSNYRATAAANNVDNPLKMLAGTLLNVVTEKANDAINNL
jgi:hypothetical protein